MAKFVFIRHALTDYNLVGSKGVFCGESDPPLNVKGTIEAQELSKVINAFGFDEVYSSTLKRAYQTAVIVLANKNITINKTRMLNEINYGYWEGLSKIQIIEKFPNEYNRFNSDPFNYYPPSGENPKSCLRRITNWIEPLKSNNSTILVFTHKTIIRLLLCHILDIPLSHYRDIFDIKIASISVLSYEKSQYKIEAINYGAKIDRIIK